jgi:hypothetical protein
MSRRIVTKSQLESMGGLESVGGPESVPARADDYFDKVVKYIPADVIAAWTTILGVTGGVGLTDESTIPISVVWILLVAFTAFTAWWTHRQTMVAQAPPARTQIIVSSIAFVVWAFALGRPFTALTGFYNPDLAAVLLIVFTFLAARIDPRQ